MVWARLQADVNCNLRRGAWYRLIKSQGLAAVVDVKGRAVPVVRAADPSSIAEVAGLAPAATQEALVVLHRAGLVGHALGRWRLAGEETA